MSLVRALTTFLIGWWPLLVLLIAWPTWLAVNGYTMTVAPSPAQIAADLIGNPAVYIPPLLWTVGLAAVGLAIGMAVGVTLGIVVWMSPLVSGAITPAALILRVVPVSALVPVVARVMGYGIGTVVFITVLLCFFPTFALTVSGLSTAPVAQRDVFTAFGGRSWIRLTRLHLPAAIPNIMVALRLTAPLSILAVLLADYLLNGGGLGALMRHAGSFYMTDREWGAALLSTALSVLCFALARRLQRVVTDRFT